MVNKKAQMKIQQMAFMIVAITIFFILVGLFALSFVFSGLDAKKQALDEQNALTLVTKLANSPEFSCESAYGTQKAACVDFDKALALKAKNESYYNFWGVDGIEILKIYPEPTIPLIKCTFSNYPNCDLLEIVVTKNHMGIAKESFITLCRKEGKGLGFYDKCELAKLIVRVENEK